MRYHVSGFNSHGEAVIADERGRPVATGELRLEAYSEPERGDVFDLSIQVVWSREEALLDWLS